MCCCLGCIAVGFIFCGAWLDARSSPINGRLFLHMHSPRRYILTSLPPLFLAVLGYVIRVYPHSQRFLSIIAVCHCETPNVYFNGWGLPASKLQKKELQLYVPSFSIQPRWNWTFFVCIYTYTNVIYLFISMYLYVNGDAEILEDVVCEYIRRFLQATLSVHLFVHEFTNSGLCWQVGKLQTLTNGRKEWLKLAGIDVGMSDLLIFVSSWSVSSLIVNAVCFECCFGSLSGLFLHSFLKGVFKFHQGLLFVVL